MADPRPGTPVHRLEVDADLSISIVSAGGATDHARLTGDGSTLTLRVDRVGALPGGLARRGVGQVADQLAAAGVSLQIVAEDGPVATLGRSGSNRTGRLVTGSRHVSIRSGRAIVRLVWATSSRGTRWSVALTGLGIAGGSIAALRARRR